MDLYSFFADPDAAVFLNADPNQMRIRTHRPQPRMSLYIAYRAAVSPDVSKMEVNPKESRRDGFGCSPAGPTDSIILTFQI